jgi:hypothetical protein
VLDAVATLLGVNGPDLLDGVVELGSQDHREADEESEDEVCNGVASVP